MKYWVNLEARNIVFVKGGETEDNKKYCLITVKADEIFTISLFGNQLNWNKTFGKFSFLIDTKNKREYNIYHTKEKKSNKFTGEQLVKILQERKIMKNLYISKQPAKEFTMDDLTNISINVVDGGELKEVNDIEIPIEDNE